MILEIKNGNTIETDVKRCVHMINYVFTADLCAKDNHISLGCWLYIQFKGWLWLVNCLHEYNHKLEYEKILLNLWQVPHVLS